MKKITFNIKITNLIRIIPESKKIDRRDALSPFLKYEFHFLFIENYFLIEYK